MCLKSQVCTVLSLTMLVHLCSCFDAVIVLSQAISVPQIAKAEPALISCKGTQDSRLGQYTLRSLRR